MIRRVSAKPIIKTNFRLLDHDNNSVVSFWFDIDAKGVKLSSQVLPAQVQHQGKLLRAAAEREFWSEETFARLSDSIDRLKAAIDASRIDFHSLAASAISTDRLVSVMETQSLRESEVAHARIQLDLLEREMATQDFFAFFNRMVIPLTCADTSDERAYALYRGSVWSCVRELESEQWSVLVDRLTEREDMELAAALAGTDPSLTRERIPTEVRRAVWIRDQGKCARCGSRERLEYDHVVPLVRGGSNTERNIELLCEVCNRVKSDSIM
jgi:hypothetical protein